MTKATVKTLYLVALGMCLVFTCGGYTSESIGLKSPDGRVAANIFINDSGRLNYNVFRRATVIIEDSPMGITVDGTDLGEIITLGKAKHHTVNERYSWRGVKSEAINHYKGIILPVTHNA
ncbi:MAG: glycoside hydrolase family 97 N-terminal domain-containing protein, partial [Planctomycetota bacterium]